MHICLISTSPPSENPFGGVQIFTTSIREWLLNKGVNVTVVGRRRFNVTVTELNSNISKTHIDPPQANYPPYLIYSLSMFLVALLIVIKVLTINKKSHLSCIHAQNTGYCGLAAIALSKLLNIPAITSSHGLRCNTINVSKDFDNQTSFFIEHWLEVITSKRTNFLITMNSSEAKYYEKIGVKKEKTCIIPIGIKTSSFENSLTPEHAKKSLGVHTNYTIGFVGRFSKEKNISTLLKAFAKVSKQIKKIKLILVGDGPTKQELTILAQKLSIIDDVIFTGFRHDVDRILPAIDLFVLPSYTEGCPTSLLEAMCSGKAIIASKIPGIKELVEHRKEAILFNPTDVDELKESILLLHNNPVLRAKLCNSAKEKAKLYDVDNVFSSILKIYKDKTWDFQ